MARRRFLKISIKHYIRHIVQEKPNFCRKKIRKGWNWEFLIWNFLKKPKTGLVTSCRLRKKGYGRFNFFIEVEHFYEQFHVWNNTKWYFWDTVMQILMQKKNILKLFVFPVKKKIFENLIWYRKNSNRFFTNPRHFPNSSQGIKLDIWAQVDQACMIFYDCFL